MLKAYEEYKKSELPWVKKIPSHWMWLRNGLLLENHKERVGDRFSDYKLLSLTTKGIKEKNIEDASGKVPDSYEGYQKVYPGDMVFCLFDLDCSAVFSGLSGCHGMITSAYDVARPREDRVSSKYLKYWFDSVFAGRYYKIYSKSVRYTINYDAFKTLKSPVPPLKEQDQIVRYLDWKTSEMNRFIHQKKKQIKMLEELKQSYIDHLITNGQTKNRETYISKADWMGDIPKEWKEYRLKNVFWEINNRSELGLEPHLSMSQKKGLVTDDEEIERRLLSESYAGAKICEKDDLVLNRLKAHLGVFALAPTRGVVSSDYTVLRINKEKVIPQYLEYLLKSNACRTELVIRVRGIVEGFWRLYTEDLGAIPICIPDIDEQRKLLEEIMNTEGKINTLIESIQKEISLVEELKVKLISDVVTGQVDVRNEVIPNYEVDSSDDEVEDDVDEESSDENIDEE